jgi:hypothetical protein
MGTIDHDGVRHPSPRLTFDDAVEIQKRLARGEYQHHIAAAYSVNPGRIAEIKHGDKFPGSRDVANGKTPPPQPRLF